MGMEDEWDALKRTMCKDEDTSFCRAVSKVLVRVGNGLDFVVEAEDIKRPLLSNLSRVPSQTII